jgi:hypothetical protein
VSVWTRRSASIVCLREWNGDGSWAVCKVQQDQHELFRRRGGSRGMAVIGNHFLRLYRRLRSLRRTYPALRSRDSYFHYLQSLQGTSERIGHLTICYWEMSSSEI